MRVSDQLSDELHESVMRGAQQLELERVHGAPPTTPARGARINLAIVLLSSEAPGCAGLPYGHPDRGRTFWDKPNEGVVRALLTRLQRLPSQVRVRRPDEDPPLSHVDLMADVGDQVGVVASITLGMASEEVAAILERLTAQGWRPAKLLSTEGKVHG